MLEALGYGWGTTGFDWILARLTWLLGFLILGTFYVKLWGGLHYLIRTSVKSGIHSGLMVPVQEIATAMVRRTFLAQLCVGTISTLFWIVRLFSRKKNHSLQKCIKFMWSHGQFKKCCKREVAENFVQYCCVNMRSFYYLGICKSPDSLVHVRSSPWLLNTSVEVYKDLFLKLAHKYDEREVCHSHWEATCVRFTSECSS